MTSVTQQALAVGEYSLFAVLVVALLLFPGCGCSVSSNRQFQHVEGAVTLRQAYLNSTTILDTTCTVADITSRQEGRSRLTTFKIDLQVTAIVKGQHEGKTIRLQWWKKERRDPRVAGSFASTWRKGSQWRLFFSETRNGQPHDPKVTPLDEGKRWATYHVEWNRKRLSDADPSVRIEAMKALMQYGTEAHVALPDIRPLMGDQVQQVREAARQALAALSEDTAE